MIQVNNIYPFKNIYFAKGSTNTPVSKTLRKKISGNYFKVQVTWLMLLGCLTDNGLLCG